MTINERIALLIKGLGMNPNSFSNKIGVSNPVIHNILKDRNKPGFDVIQKIVLTFDNINTDWLIMGSGNMLKEHPSKMSVMDAEKNKTYPITAMQDFVKRPGEISEKSIRDWYVKKDTIMKLMRTSITGFDKSYEDLSSLGVELEIAIGHIESFYSHIEDAISVFADKKLSKEDIDTLVKGTQYLIEPILDMALFYAKVLPVLKDANKKYRDKYKDRYEIPEKRSRKKS